MPPGSRTGGRAGSLLAPAVERRPRHPQLGGHLIDRQQRVIRGCGFAGRGGGGAGRERLAFPGAARPWVRHDARSAPPAASSPAPARPARAGRGPGRPARGPGERGPALGPGGRGPAPQTRCAAGRCQAGGPALPERPTLPEGKAVRGGRGVVPGGDRRHALAGAGGGGGRPGCRPAGRAGLPPGTAGIQPPLRPPRQADRRGTGLDTRPRATRRYGPVPDPPGGAGPARGPAAGRVPRRGTVARTAKVRATVVHARAAGQPGAGTPGRAQRVILLEGSVIGWLVPPCCRFFRLTQKSGFEGLFSLAPGNWCWRGRARRLLQGSGAPPVVLFCTWRVPAQVSVLMYLAGSGRRGGNGHTQRYRRPAGTGTRQVHVQTARPGRLFAVTAAPSARAAHYAALGAASALVPGPPAASGAGAGAAGASR